MFSFRVVFGGFENFYRSLLARMVPQSEAGSKQMLLRERILMELRSE